MNVLVVEKFPPSSADSMIQEAKKAGEATRAGGRSRLGCQDLRTPHGRADRAARVTFQRHARDAPPGVEPRLRRLPCDASTDRRLSRDAA